MDPAFFRDFAQRCRVLMQGARSDAARQQFRLWADELDRRAEESKSGLGDGDARDVLKPNGPPIGR
jgi:hypothetical protein